MWRKKSKIRWLSERNNNTKLFHTQALMRKKRNKLSSIKIGDRIVKKVKEITSQARKHFKCNYMQESLLEIWIPEYGVEKLSPV